MIKELSKQRIRKFWNVKLATNPGRVVLNVIILINILLFVISSLVLRSFKIPGSEDMGYAQSTFYLCWIFILE